MPIYERGPVRIHYEEMGSGFPLLVIPGGGLNSTIAGLDTSHPFNAMKEFANADYTDYKDMDGLKLPTKIAIKLDDKNIAMELSELKPVEKVEESQFDRP